MSVAIGVQATKQFMDKLPQNLRACKYTVLVVRLSSTVKMDVELLEIQDL